MKLGSRLFGAALVFASPMASAALAQSAGSSDTEGQAWVSAWATAQQMAPAPKLDLPPPPAAALKEMAKAPQPIVAYPEKLNDQTVRMIVRPTLGGSAVRIQLSNAMGAQPVRLGAAHIAMVATGAAIKPLTDRLVTFAGKGATTIMPGSVVVSDPVKLEVPAGSDVAVSLYIPGETPTATVHPLGLNTSYVVAKDLTGAEHLTNPQTNRSYFWLTGLEVVAQPGDGAIVAFGDSITDGYGTTPEAHRAWPELLATRLGSEAPAPKWSVLNMGISGNRICRDGAGVSGLARLDRDVLSRPGVRWVILLEGINDINMTGIPGMPENQRATANEIIACYSQFIDKLHLHGIKVMGATVMPTEGLWLHSAETENMRTGVNAWIRSSARFDAVADFDKAVRDPVRTAKLAVRFDPGDHIHPNDEGNDAMAKAIDLRAFQDH